ncbi:MAG TPA: molecular chaperone TorD family protein [Symbiobacteriaceae bacterium]|nr:molecular chaperone TorD family protein [Symbiobacteriaceae bacterium]
MTSPADLTLPYEIRAQVYQLLAALYLSPPDQTALDALRNPSFVADFPLGRGAGDVEAGLSRLAEALPGVTDRGLMEEFWHLFGTLGPAAAPPWQSVYLDREHVLMGEETLRVRALFARFGLASALADRQPEDHLGLQLQFLSIMAARTAEQLAAGDEAGARLLLEGTLECLEANLLRWVDQFARLAEAASETGFYAGLSRLTLGLLRFDQDQVRQTLTEPSLI